MLSTIKKTNTYIGSMFINEKWIPRALVKYTQTHNLFFLVGIDIYL